MAEIMCVKCGHVGRATLPGSDFTSDCPECGGMMRPRKIVEAEREKKKEEEDLVRMKEHGWTPPQYKVVPLGGIGGVAGTSDIQRVLDDMGPRGWEFVFFCDGPHLVSAGSPALIFRKR